MDTFPAELQDSINLFFDSYRYATRKSLTPEKRELLLNEYLTYVRQEVQSPTQFGCYHEQERAPHDYYQFGLEMLRPLIKWQKSHFLGHHHLAQIERLIASGENVILFSNHQSEADPQIISLFFEKEGSHLAEHMIFIAGHRVVTDPFAIPFSRGRNLICIHSKRYIEHPPEKKEEKLLHNRMALSALEEKLHAGGACVYVAPAGGRDRKGALSEFEVAPFDVASVELFILLGQKARRKTHFFPLSLMTFGVLPPPETVRLELGEPRVAHYAPCGVHIGHEIAIQPLPEGVDKKSARQERTDAIYQQVKQNYEKIFKICNDS